MLKRIVTYGENIKFGLKKNWEKQRKAWKVGEGR